MLARHRSFARAYEYWILGLDVNQREPRWSAVRDVLHWVDWPVNSP